jgi:putative tricarboxylic transport membrane protein
MRRPRSAVLLALAIAGAAAAQPSRCVVPAKPGGGFDLTCALARVALQPAVPELAVVYQPGGIGALVFNEVVSGRRQVPGELVAFSSGTLLNLAQGRFGRHGIDAVTWVAALALDHGVVVVHRDAPWRDLPQLLAALRANPNAIVFASGGTIGSQDWMKAALIARAAGVGHKAVRVVAFEGGGDALQALRGRHVQVLPGDAAEVAREIEQGAPVRVLAVLADARLAGPLAAVPTAREQGVDIRWPILRGVYAGAGTAPAAVAETARLLLQGQQRDAYRRELLRLGLQPAMLVGEALQREVQAQVSAYRELARSFGLPGP